MNFSSSQLIWFIFSGDKSSERSTAADVPCCKLAKLTTTWGSCESDLLFFVFFFLVFLCLIVETFAGESPAGHHCCHRGRGGGPAPPGLDCHCLLLFLLIIIIFLIMKNHDLRPGWTWRILPTGQAGGRTWWPGTHDSSAHREWQSHYFQISLNRDDGDKHIISTYHDAYDGHWSGVSHAGGRKSSLQFHPRPAFESQDGTNRLLGGHLHHDHHNPRQHCHLSIFWLSLTNIRARSK